MPGISPTSRTLNYLRAAGYLCDIVERWIKMPTHPAGGYRKDFLGFGDIIAITDNEILAVQSCGVSFSQHCKDIITNENVIKWLAPRRKIMVIGWRKLKLKRGGKAMRWHPRIAKITLEQGELKVNEF